MPNCLSNFCPSFGSAEAYLASLLVKSWPEMVHLVSKPVSIAIFTAGLIGLLVGWLVRGREASPEPAPLPSLGTEELRWRHEKLVLTERQQVEKQSRLDLAAESLSRHTTVEGIKAALLFFVLAERVREARQKTGTDLSRMLALQERLATIPISDGRENEAIRASARMASLRSATLEEARDQLREISERVFHLEEEVVTGRLDLSDAEADPRLELRDIKGEILALPQGWATAGDETDRQIRELLAMVRHPEIDAVRDILLIDGAMTLSLSGSGGIDLAGAVSEVMAACELSKAEPRITVISEIPVAHQAESPAGIPEKPVVEAEDLNGITALGITASRTPGELSAFSDVPFLSHPALEPVNEGPVPVSLMPDKGFRDPRDFAKNSMRAANGFHDLTTNHLFLSPSPAQEFSEEAPAESRTLILFCSNQVELWGTEIYRGTHCRARMIKDFPDWAQWISIRRVDTKERVFAPVRTASLFNGQTSDPIGFNGTNELFYGARHLGIFSESCPNEVETRFTYGGWGFGHRANEITPEEEQLQAAGWEGREIPADTVFEIVIHEDLPALGSLDRLLEVPCSVSKT